MRPLRHLVLGESGEALVEVTSRTVHGRFLTLPSTVAYSLILGILGRAQERYEVKVCAFAFLWNHYGGVPGSAARRGRGANVPSRVILRSGSDEGSRRFSIESRPRD